MLNGWLENIKSIGVFLICAQMLIHFRPSGAYVKYLRLLVSIMILVQFLEPFGNLFGLLEKGELQRQVGKMEKKMLQIQSESHGLGTDVEEIWDRLLQDVEIPSEEGDSMEFQGEEE